MTEGLLYRCKTAVFGSQDYHGHNCNRPVTVVRDGIGYCGVHDPVAQEARRKARGPTKWERERQEKDAERERVRQRIEKLEAINADLLAACEALQQSLKQLRGGSLRRQVEEETALELGRVAITKAKEEKRCINTE